jgi:lysophospholipase L1-like esterase
LISRLPAGAALALAGAAALGGSTVARTPAATPAPSSDEDLASVAAQLRYVHLEKIYGYLPGMQDEAILAAIFGVSVETYREARAMYAEAVAATATELLADEEFAAEIDALPFGTGDVVVGIGESDTDDLQSALEMLRRLVELRRPDDDIEIVNLAISGQTTTEAVGRMASILMQRQPDRVICGLGGNDTLRNGAGATKPLVSIEETERNLAELRHLATTQHGAEFVFLTRWQIDPERIAAYPVFTENQVRILPEDWDAVNEAIRRQEGRVIDLVPVFGSPPVEEYLEPDGLHPTLAGQRELVRAMVAGLNDAA